MAGIRVVISGLGQLNKELNKIKNGLPKAVGDEIEIGAEKVRADAVNDAPSGAGNILRSGIGKAQVDKTSWEVLSNASYSGYVEFGTKSKVQIPAGLEEIAAKIKSEKSTGSAEDALRSIMEWVRLKGIRFDSAATFQSGKKKGQNKQLTYEQTAYIIFRHIMLHGITPHPFFFKQLDKNEKEIINDVENGLENLVR